MYDSILLPVDEAAAESSLLYHAAELANWDDARVELLFVADTNRDSVTVSEGNVIDVLVDEGEKVVDEASRLLDSLGVEYTTSVEQGTPAETIVDYAEKQDHDLIAIPTHGREGLSRYLLGSVTGKVVRLAPMPVLTAPIDEEGFEFPYGGMLLPTDGSDTALRAARHGLDFAAELDADVHVITVTEDSMLASAGDAVGEGESASQAAIDEIAEAAERRGVDVTTHTETGDTDEEVLACVEQEGLDAIVMGATGRSGLDRVLLGSVAEKVVRSADVPVITVGGD
ncbi:MULTISPECIES: universal stress protein [Halolamina]|uniref:Nucleotide-binding universal stress protein, UspA family n=1 Tax=Halolamina pelagica TaxID=699431 RepID=A0A1I5NP50_9EURY|nr:MULTISPECIES: universal stress protein [Halolamina]NHX36408.1 universal stress protein [Halolamina sp. R1-12]SFP23457.1 Nucleotide-binding universal stress protein, UspA family [Halolamina pelagica]